jgi:hypothetical protein
MGGYICSRFAVLFLSEGHNFIGQVRSSDTSSCFDRRRAARFRSADYPRNSDRASANILGRDAFVSVGLPMAFQQRDKAQKFYPWPIVAQAPLRVVE